MENKLLYRKSISFKITTYYFVLILAIIIVLLIVISGFIRTNYVKSLQSAMDSNITIIRTLIKNSSTSESMKQDLKNISNSTDQRITIIGLNGIVIVDTEVPDISSLDNHFYRPEIQQALENGTGSSIRYSESIKTDMLYYAQKSNKHYIRLSKSLSQINTTLAHVRKLIIISGVFTAIISLLISLFISSKITSPIKELIIFSEQFASGNFSHRILNYSNNELGILQKSLNKLADKLHIYISKLTNEKKKLSITIETIQDSIAVINSAGKIILTNNAFHSLFKVAEAPLLKNYYEVIRSSEINSRIESSIQTFKMDSFNVKLQTEEFCEVYINPIIGDEDQQSLLIVLRDVTEKKKTEKMKTDLVGNLSHELKTPLTIIKGYLETIEINGSNQKVCKEYIGKALDNVERQNSIINDMLKLNMLETIKDFEHEKINLSDIINNCVMILDTKAAKKEIEMTIDLSQLPETITANNFLAEGIFFNLIHNAINYNKVSGSIHIMAKKFTEVNRHYLVISIVNTGIGIPVESIDRLFERFYRADKGRSRSTGGTGLGLSIVKHSIDLLNWEIKVVSSTEDTKFTVIIPT